jgi:protein involved in polysaccharide export with SLBB domain
MKDYVVEPPDVLLVEVLEALPGRPISGERLVRPDGKISLGFYGDVYVAGLTIPEVKEKIILQVRKFVSDETLGILEVDNESNELKLDANGKPIPIKNLRDCDRVFVDVTAYNSKAYYILGEVVTPGRLPVTGRDTILDAVNYAGGLTPRANHDNVVLYRQAKGGALQKLHVDLDQIMMGDDLSTNYQLEPGDRLVVPPLARPAPDASRTDFEQPATAAARRPGLPLQFNRHDTKPPTGRDQPPQATFGVAEQATLRRLEQRLGEVERKLDLILKALEPKAP